MWGRDQESSRIGGISGIQVEQFGSVGYRWLRLCIKGKECLLGRRVEIGD